MIRSRKERRQAHSLSICRVPYVIQKATTMLNSSSTSSAPRILGGEISEMYTDATILKHADADATDEPRDHQHQVVHRRRLQHRTNHEDAHSHDDRVLLRDLVCNPSLVKRT